MVKNLCTCLSTRICKYGVFMNLNYFKHSGLIMQLTNLNSSYLLISYFNKTYKKVIFLNLFKILNSKAKSTVLVNTSNSGLCSSSKINSKVLFLI